MRIEWQATRELAEHTVSVSLAVEIEGQTDSAALRATRYLDNARQLLDPAFWEEERGPQSEDPQDTDDEPQSQGQGQGQGQGRVAG